MNKKIDSSSIIEELKLIAGDSVSIKGTFVLSVSHDCVLTREMVLEAKRAFADTLRRCLDESNH